jgi:hypothetical protein
MKYKILMMSAACVMAACTPTAATTKVETAQSLVDALTYAKSKTTGLCFGVGTVERMDSRGTIAENNLVVAVDCSAVGLQESNGVR